jgi:uncharacterized coiled-coil protein SlyX
MTIQEASKMEEKAKTQEENMIDEEEQNSKNEPGILKTRIDELEKTTTEKDFKINGLEQKLAESSRQQKETDNRLAAAVHSYRTLIMGNNAEIPAELITGNSIEEIDKSLANAKALVTRIRQGLENETAATRIPSGAPVRTEADISGLSPIEKIKYAIGRR